VYGETYYYNDLGSITITRTIIYEGNMAPSPEISWREKIAGTVYAGTMALTGFRYDKAKNKTTATYTGTLTAQ